MITYSKAQELLSLIASKVELAIEEVLLLDSVGRVLAQDLQSAEFIPQFKNSAMDGFVLNAAETISATTKKPVEFKVFQCMAAGDWPVVNAEELTAVEIMTGAPIPNEYYNSVIKIEEVSFKKDSKGNIISVLVSREVRTGEHIRNKGEDFRPGQVLLNKGQIIQTQHVLALATLGINRIAVYKKPNLTILSTGKELVPHTERKLGSAQIRNSTAPYLVCYLSELGFNPKFEGIVADAEDVFISKIEDLLQTEVDVIITTGAVSMGKYDFIKIALEKIGAEIHFHKCAIRPGKPILFASLKKEKKIITFFGMPGNPISTAVGAKFFLIPFLRQVLGIESEIYHQAYLAQDYKKPEGLRCFFNGEVYSDQGKYMVKVLPGQASFMVSSLLKANSWVVFPENATNITKNTLVEVYNL